MNKELSFIKTEVPKNKLESALDCIMTADEYSHTSHEKPYVYELKTGEKQLTYFGSPHIRDPKSPIFSQIKKSFIEANPNIVFVEGVYIKGDTSAFTDKLKTMSDEVVIDTMGEAGYILKLAVEKELPWHCPEPSEKKLYENLEDQGFSREQIFAWDVFRLLPQYEIQLNQNGFEEYATVAISYFKSDTNWENF